MIPENVNGAVVFNVISSCNASKSICGNCADFAVAIHNWMMNSEIKYVLVDLQDEKEICGAFLEEMMQLAKRLKVPFLFAGVMEKPKKILQSYDFSNRWPTFTTPDEAISYLDKNFPGVTKVSLEGMEFGVAVATSRPRNAVMVDVEAEAETAE